MSDTCPQCGSTDPAVRMGRRARPGQPGVFVRDVHFRCLDHFHTPKMVSDHAQCQEALRAADGIIKKLKGERDDLAVEKLWLVGIVAELKNVAEEAEERGYVRGMNEGHEQGWNDCINQDNWRT